jgi:hypothetical protein
MRRSLLLTLALSLTAAAPAFAGPPWISIELPANPYNPATRDAFCLVRVYHHGDAAYYPVQGRAEGLVNGQRRTVNLTLVETGTPGVYAVRYQPEGTGTWVLVFRVGKDGEYEGATVVVTLGKNGQIASARVPTRKQGQHLIPERVTTEVVDRMLRDEAAR